MNKIFKRNIILQMALIKKNIYLQRFKTGDRYIHDTPFYILLDDRSIELLNLQLFLRTARYHNYCSIRPIIRFSVEPVRRTLTYLKD